MECPRCHAVQSDGPECLKCGIVVARWLARRDAEAAELAKAAAIAEAPEPPPPADSPPRRRRSPALLFGPGRASLRDASTSLARLLSAGIGLQEALLTIAGGAGPRLRVVLLDVAERIAAGASLSGALAEHPALFRPADLQALRAGERIGAVPQAFLAIADRLQGQIDVRRELWKRAAYPLTVLGLSIVLTPVPLVLTGGAAAYLASVVRNLVLVFALAVLLGFVLPQLLASSALGDRLRAFAWHAPWPASVYTAAVRATFLRVLARNLDAGLPLFESLETAASVTADPATAARAAACAHRVSEGHGLAESLGASRLVPPGDLMLLVSGERAGTLVPSLDTLAATYTERMTRGVRTLLTAASVLLTLAVFAWVAYGILEAYAEINRHTLQQLEEIEKELPWFRL